MYVNGVNMSIEKLYPEIKFPVSRGTRMLSPLVRWEHSEDWFVPKFELQRTSNSWERKVKVSLKDQDYDSIDGHIIDGILQHGILVHCKPLIILNLCRSLSHSCHCIHTTCMGNDCYDKR